MKLIKLLLPEFLINLINIFFRRKIIIRNDYNSWKKALKNSTGYNSNLIFYKTKKSFEKVLAKKAKFERDSVLFYKNEPNNQLIRIIKTLYKDNKINICDFGGSLGSLYFQNIDYLDQNKITWNIVEQKKYVKYASSKLSIKNLNFFLTIDEVFKKKIDLVILSSVLHYLEFPDYLLDKISKKKIENLIISRTPFHDNQDTIKIQEVPKNIYKASYPVRIFNKRKFIKKMKTRGFKIKKKINTFEKLDNFNYYGFYFRRN